MNGFEESQARLEQMHTHLRRHLAGVLPVGIKTGYCGGLLEVILPLEHFQSATRSVELPPGVEKTAIDVRGKIIAINLRGSDPRAVGDATIAIIRPE